MSLNPKTFETRFKNEFQEAFPEGTIIRLYDSMSGYKSISNISDFIGYAYPNVYFLECKTHKGASIPFEKISQYDKLIKVAGIKGIRAGVVLFLYEKDKVYYIPAKTIEQMKADGKKSVGLKAVEEGYRIVEVPSVKQRVFMKSDYSILRELKEGD